MKVYRIIEDYGGYDGGEVTIAVCATRVGAELALFRAKLYAAVWREFFQSVPKQFNEEHGCWWCGAGAVSDTNMWEIQEHEVIV